MTENSKAKSHLKGTETTLSNLGIANVPEIDRIIASRSLDLFSNLHTGNNLFIDNEVRSDIQNVYTRLQAGSLVADARAEIIDLNTEEAALPVGAASAARRAEIGRERRNLLQITGGTAVAPGAIGHANILARRTEYNNIHTYANYFNTGNRINNIEIDITTPPGASRSTIMNINQNLDTIFKTAATNPGADLSLCDEQGVPLPQPTTGNYTVQLGGQTVILSGIALAGRSLDMTNLTISPASADLSQPLKLSINATYPAATIGVNNINVVCNKKFELQLRKGPKSTQVNTATLRESEIDNYNTTAPGNIVTNELSSQYANSFPSLQREAVFDALRHLDGTRFSQLEEYGRKNGKEQEIKEELYQQIYRNFLTTGMIATNLANLNNYVGFRTRFAHDDRTWNSDKKIIESGNAYQNHLHTNLKQSVQDYLKDELNDILSQSTATNIRLKTELSNFLTSIENRKNDNERNAIGQTITEATEANIGANDLMTKHRRKRFLGIERGRNDVSYTRFFNGSSYEIKDQKVDISTNTRIEDLNNPEPVQYDLKTEISGKNNITVKITFPGKDKRYPIKDIQLKQGEVSTLARKILNCPNIRDFKVRTHIVYNLLISMIEMSKKRNLSLKYRIPGTTNQREIIKNDKNITLYERNDTGGVRTERTLFDYDKFITTNTFHDLGNPRSLQTAIDELMGHFNFAMNEFHEGYRNATRNRLLKTKVSANSFWTSPIKTILNLRTTRKFDFTSSAKSEDGKKNVEMAFEKNQITLKMGDIERKGQNLGKLLEYRKDKIRVFDGVERDIIFSFYDGLTKKLRENSKISRSNFGVRNPLTQNIYVMDEDGQLGIVTPEDPGNILGNNNEAIIRKDELDAVDARGGRRMCSEEETKEAFMNPMIMGRMIKAMNKRMKRL